MRLETLNLSNNNLGGDGAEAIGALLGDPRMRCLAHLSLRGAGIGPEGAGEVAFGLQRNETLKSLDVSRNSIGKAGKAALGAALLNAGRHGGGRLDGAGLRRVERGLR